MADSQLKQTSKFLSYVLRHKPESIGLGLDAHGWASVEELLAQAAVHGIKISVELLHRVVQENDKQRFILDSDRARIRANQGHSIPVDLELAPQDPPARLFHGTATRFIPSIRDRGLVRGSRQYVHLSRDISTATAVGERHGKPAILPIRADQMAKAGYTFYLSRNRRVWLTEAVPNEFIDWPE
jgi:putative RNA 2'-phosphotransferase